MQNGMGPPPLNNDNDNNFFQTMVQQVGTENENFMLKLYVLTI